MEEKRPKEDSACRQKNDKRKQLYNHSDLKEKLSLMKRKVDDLQHERRMAYKTAVKIRKVVHNQINQIVQCLRSRENSLCLEIDDAHHSQDENISQELLRMQYIYSNGQTLLGHLEDNPHNGEALSKIKCTLAQVNFETKLNSKAFRFTSEFENLKTMAANFGKLEEDVITTIHPFVEKDEFIVIHEYEDGSIKKLYYNEDCFQKAASEKNIEKKDASYEHLSIKTDLEDLFEVVSFSDNVCHEEPKKDFHMADQDNFENGCRQIEKLSLSNKSGKKLKDSNNFENSQNASKDKDFNPEEEWEHLFELKNRVSTIYGMLPKLENESFSSGNQNLTSSSLNPVKTSNRFVHLSPSEVKDWLPKKSTKKLSRAMQQKQFLFETRGPPKKQSELEKNKIAKSYDQSQINSRCKPSPAEILRREFQKYSVKDGIENWLLR